MSPQNISIESLLQTADPFPLFAKARVDCPVAASEAGWLILGYEEVNALLRSKDLATGHLSAFFAQTLPEGAARSEMVNRINFLDEPAHGRVRKLAVKAFSPKRMEALSSFIRDLCQSRIDEFSGQHSVELRLGFAHDIPTLAISELLGIPGAERQQLGDQANDVAELLFLPLGPLSAEVMEGALSSAELFHARLAGLIEERRAAPANDLLSALVAVEEDGERLSMPELLSLVATLYSAGHRTTRDFFVNCLALLFENPSVLAQYRENSINRDHVIEECLRMVTPTMFVGRRAIVDIEVGGVKINAGEGIALVMPAANRDPEVYEDPDKFDPSRWRKGAGARPQTAFAFGPHFCLGAHLARLEIRIMLETLLTRFPDIQLAVPPQWHQHGIYRTVRSLEILTGT